QAAALALDRSAAGLRSRQDLHPVVDDLRFPVALTLRALEPRPRARRDLRFASGPLAGGNQAAGPTAALVRAGHGITAQHGRAPYQEDVGSGAEAAVVRPLQPRRRSSRICPSWRSSITIRS